MELSKDTYLYLTQFADNRTILNMLSVNKKFNDDMFFEQVMKRKYPLLISQKQNYETWKHFFLKNIYYISKIEEQYGIPYIPTTLNIPKTMYKSGDIIYNLAVNMASYAGDIGLVKKIMKNHPEDFKYSDSLYIPLMFAAIGNHKDIIELMIQKGADINYGLRGAAESGNLELVNYMIKQGADDWDMGLIGASSGGNLELVKLMINKGADDFDVALSEAAGGGHIDIVELMLQKGATNVDYALMGSATLGIAKLMIEHGAKDFNYALIVASREGNIEIIDFLIEKGAANLNEALIAALDWGNIDVAKHLINKGATNIDEALEKAKLNNNKLVVNYLK